MGYYIQAPTNTGKADYFVANEGAKLISRPVAFSDIPAGKALVVVVDNVLFEAAAYCYDAREFQEFVNNPYDLRPKRYLLMDEARVKEMSGYRES